MKQMFHSFLNLDSEENLERISICMRPQTVHTPTHDPKPGAGTMNLALFFLEAQLFHSLLLSTAPLKQPAAPYLMESRTRIMLKLS